MARADFLLVRQDHVLCTICCKIEPVHAGHGTPLPTLMIAYEGCINRHAKCSPRKKEQSK